MAKFNCGDVVERPDNSAFAARLPRRFTMANAEMNGYDMVVALTQNLINSQLAAISQNPNAPPPPPGAPPSDLPIKSSFTAQLNPSAAPGTPEAWPCVEVTEMNAPTITIQANNQVIFTLHILEGTVRYIDSDNSQQSISTGVMDVSFTVNMALATVDDVNSLAAPDQTKTQLSGFQSSDFTIQALALDFENSNLIGTVSVSSQDSSLNSSQITTLTTCFSNYLSALQGSSNPYILGYPIQSNQPANTNPTLPEFAPTSCEFSTTPYPNPPSDSYEGLSTLNYCLMTQHHAFPTAANRGIFNTPWVSGLSQAGTLTIDRNIFVSGYVVNYVLPQVKKALNINANWGQYGDPNYWNISSDTNNDPDDTGLGECIDSDGLNMYLFQEEKVNCDLRLTATGEIQITANGYFYIHLKEQQFSGIPGVYVNVGEVEETQNWHLTITFNIGTNGQFNLTSSTTMDTPITSGNPGFLESIGDWFAKLFGSDVTTVEEALQSKAQGFVNGFNDTFNSFLAQDMDVLKNQFVLPAGGVFYYNSLDFNSVGDMQSSIAGYQAL